MSSPARISYVIMAVLLALIGWLHLGVLVLTALFGCFALRLFSFGRSKLLVPGEKLMGIPGMILAPVVLHYIKVEASRNKVTEVAAGPVEPRSAV